MTRENSVDEAAASAIGVVPREPGAARRAVWAVCFATAAVAAVVATRGPHWCFAPIWACGVVTSWQAARELALSHSVLRVGSAVWSFLVFFVFVAPLLHISWNFWLRYVVLPVDMRPWMGALATWTLAGLLAMVAGQRLARHASAYWQPVGGKLRRRRFLLLGALMIALGAVAQVAVYCRFGGYAGLFAAFERSFESFAGAGPLVVVAATLPTVAGALILALFPRQRLAHLGIPLLLSFTVLVVAIAGPYGSRANILVPLVWAVVAWERLVAPLRWRGVVLIGAAAVAFLLSYGFYKSLGHGALAALPPPGTVKAAIQEKHRPLLAFLLLDFGRYDVQALLLERIAQPDHWRLGHGRTYVGGILSLVPRRLYPNKPDSKVREGTAALHDPELAQRGFAATNQFGLAGEAVLNFGPWAIPGAYGLFGLLIGFLSRLENALGRRDPRWLLLAFAPALAVRALMTDSDNVALLLFQSYVFLGPLVFLSTRRPSARSPS